MTRFCNLLSDDCLVASVIARVVICWADRYP